LSLGRTAVVAWYARLQANPALQMVTAIFAPAQK